jgi:hypothetical protein
MPRRVRSASGLAPARGSDEQSRVEQLRAELTSVARETLRALVEGPPEARRRVAELDARATALRSAIKEASPTAGVHDPEWLPGDAWTVGSNGHANRGTDAG